MELAFLVEALELTALEEIEQRGAEQTGETATFSVSGRWFYFGGATVKGGFSTLSSVKNHFLFVYLRDAAIVLDLIMLSNGNGRRR